MGPSTQSPQVLVDGWPDDIIETCAWVEVTPSLDSPGKALDFIERQFPLEDREPHETYDCDGETEWMVPEGERLPDGNYVQWPSGGGQPWRYDPAEGPWVTADGPRQLDARKFWIVKVICGGVG
jgi:hypothetical protein